MLIKELAMLAQKTKFTPNQEISRQNILVDATDQRMGRLAAGVAHRLMGKHRTDFSGHQDLGDFVVVINLKRVSFTGNKLDTVNYYDHSLYPGGLKTTTMREQFSRGPDKLFMRMVKGMLPKGPLGRRMLENLRAYAGAAHENQGQQPILITAEKLK